MRAINVRKLRAKMVEHDDTVRTLAASWGFIEHVVQDAQRAAEFRSS